MNGALFTLVRKLRPELTRLEGPGRAQSFLEVVIGLYLLPLAGVGLSWLIALTEVDAITRNFALFSIMARL